MLQTRLAQNNKQLEVNKTLLAQNINKINALKESIALAVKERDAARETYALGMKNLDALKVSRDSIIAERKACYEKLLAIKKAKNTAKGEVAVDAQQQLPSPVFPSANNNDARGSNVGNIDVKTLGLQPTSALIAAAPIAASITATPAKIDMVPINANAAQKLGDILFDHYKDSGHALPANIKERFFQEVGYDSSLNIISADSSLEKIFSSFNSFLKEGGYRHLVGNNSFLSDIQSRYARYNIEC